MKRTILTVLLTCFLTPIIAQDYTITTGGIVTEVTFYSPAIVRVSKYQASDVLGKSDPKVVVTMTPQAVSHIKKEGEKIDSLITDRVMVTCNKQTGVLGFYRPDGTTLLKERAKATFTKRTSHTIDPYNVTQSFKLSSGEAIYGFGQVQDGNLNHRNKSYSHMVQNNMSVWIPFFHSTRGYGLYWDLYGPCDFTDNASTGATFTTEAAHAVDYYLLVGSESNGDEVVQRLREGWLAITELRTAVLWVKASSGFSPDYCAEHLPTSPWIHQPFERYDGSSPEKLLAKWKGKF